MSCDDFTWRKSSHSEASDNECVEIWVDGAVVLIRDSKNPAGPVLRVSAEAWSTFVDAVREDLIRSRLGGLPRMRQQVRVTHRNLFCPESEQ